MADGSKLFVEECLNTDESYYELFGDIKVQVLDFESNNKIFEFLIKQKNMHSEIVCPIDKKLILTLDEQRDLLSNQDANLLYVATGNEGSLIHSLRYFDLVFFSLGKEKSNGDINNEFFNLSYLLSLYRRQESICSCDLFNLFKKYKIDLSLAEDVRIYYGQSHDVRSPMYETLSSFFLEIIKCDRIEFLEKYVLNGLILDPEEKEYKCAFIEYYFRHDISKVKQDVGISEKQVEDRKMFVSSDYMFFKLEQKTLMSKFIKEASLEDFIKYISNVDSGDLSLRIVFCDLCAFEYAVKIGEFEKAEEIAKACYGVFCYQYIASDDQGQYTAIGLLIKEGRYDIILPSIEKVPLDMPVYKDCHDLEYTLKDYIIDVIKDKSLANKLKL